MMSGKAPGPDSIPAEVFNTGGESIHNKLTSLFQTMWNQEHLPQEFRDVTIVLNYKCKGNCQLCDNHQGISPLSIAGKTLNCLLCHLEQGLHPESQCGFRTGRGPTNMIFAACQLQEKCMEQHCDLYLTFIDLTKDYDTISQDGLSMEKFGTKFIAIVCQFHDGLCPGQQ